MAVTFHRSRFTRRTAIGLGAGAGTAAFLAACGSREAKDSAAQTEFNQANVRETTEQPVPGGTINFSATDVPNYDYQVSFSVLQTLYANRLLRYKTGSTMGPNQYEIIPDLALSYEAPDPRKVTVKLNQAATFQDKAPVGARALTSEDVKATFELLNTNKPNYVYRYLVDFIETIETPAPDTVVFTLAYPTTLIYNALAYYNSAIAPKEIIARDGNLEKNDQGTGPFTLERYERGSGYSFKKNPNYFRTGTPYVDGVELAVVNDASSRLDAYRAGRLDAMDLAVDQLPAVKRTLDEDSTLQTQPGVGWSAFIFNILNPPYNDPRVRQAFSLALDRAAINQLAGDSTATVRTGPIARGWPAWTRSDEEIAPEAAQDIAKAKQLLTAAGYPNGFETEWIFGPYAGTVDTSTKIAQVAQEQLKATGIQMKITMMENLAWQRRLQQQDFSLSTWLIRAYPDPDDYLYPFWVPGAAKNFGKVDDPALTDLVLKQRQTAEPETRKKLLQEIDRRWTQDFNYGVWTIEYPFAHIYNNRLRNYSSRNPLDYAGMAEVFIKQ
ncbi:MAG: ABC transporter substrate-binding protein [Dehalococcoidia bacterium]